MANCYICGKPHAEYRRNVPTGTSYRTSYSSRGRSYNSSSVRYGRRSVCAHCAFNIDYNNKRSTGFILSFLFGGSLIAIGVLCGIIFQYKISYNQGIGCVFLGLLILILGSALTQRKANKWKEENEREYIDSYEIIQQEKLQKSIERENKKKQKFAERQQTLINILNTFKDKMQTEIKFLVSKAEVFSKEHENCKDDTIEQIDGVIKDITLFADEMKSEYKKVENEYSQLIRQIKNLELESEADDYVQTIVNLKVHVVNTINQLLNQCREQENIMLQEKIKFLQNSSTTQ